MRFALTRRSIWCFAFAITVSAVPALADQTGKTASGATYVIPDGMTIAKHDGYISLELPEGGAHFAIVELSNAASPQDAAAKAWQIYAPGKMPRVHTDEPRRDHFDWDEERYLGYETPPNANRMVQARAFRHGADWTVTIFDASNDAFEKHEKALSAAILGLKPPGFQPETFAGRKPRQLDADKIEAVKNFVREGMRELSVPGAALALVDHGKIVFEGGFGVRYLGKPEPVEADTLFMTGSTGKALTTLLLAKLVDQGKMRWDQPAADLYPAFKLASAATTRKILVRHLVCACTGVPRKDYEWTLNPADTTPESVFGMLAATEPTTGFGEAYQYSNQMAAAAGYIAAHIVDPDREIGAAYDALMQREIFDPLGMQNTTFDMSKALNGNHAGPHGNDVDGNTAHVDIDADQTVHGIRPAGGAWSTVHDMAQYLALELTQGKLPDGRQFVSAQNLLERRKPSVPDGIDAYYAMGLHIDKSSGATVVGHSGSVPGFLAEFIILPDADIGAVLLLNDSAGEMMLDPFQRRLLELIYDGRTEATPDLANFAERARIHARKDREKLTVPADPALTARLADRYLNADLGHIAVIRHGGDTLFDFGGWQSEVASRANPDGTVSFLTIRPGKDGLEFVVSEKNGKQTLITRDSQHEYVYEQQP